MLVSVDLRDAEAVEVAFEAAARALGTLDILVNNVGTIVWKDFDELTAEEWRDCIDGTLFVTLFASRAALPHMRRGRFGRIINILDADADALNPVPYATAYKIGKKAAFSQCRQGEGMGFSLRTEGYRYTRWLDAAGHTDQEELYDYDRDPEETTSVQDDPSYQEVLTDLRYLMDAGWRECQP